MQTFYFTELGVKDSAGSSLILSSSDVGIAIGADCVSVILFSGTALHAELNASSVIRKRMTRILSTECGFLEYTYIKLLIALFNLTTL